VYKDKNNNNHDSKNDCHGNRNLPTNIKVIYPTLVQCYRYRITDHMGDRKKTFILCLFPSMRREE